VFRVKIEDIAKKLAIAWAILWNFYMILICVFLFILTVLILKRIIFDFWNTLLHPLDNQEKVYIIIIQFEKRIREKKKLLDKKRKEGYNRYFQNLKARIS